MKYQTKKDAKKLFWFILKWAFMVFIVSLFTSNIGGAFISSTVGMLLTLAIK